MESQGLQALAPDINMATVTDGRGGIFTYYPSDPIVEVNLVMINSGKVRGFHFHKEFDEYFMIISGFGVYVSYDQDGKIVETPVSGGEMFKVPKGTPHVVYAIETLRCVSMLTKRWNDCAEPITFSEVTP